MFFYKTPIDYLLITTDVNHSVVSAVFSSQKGDAKQLTEPVLLRTLDSYFFEGVSIPPSLHKKEIHGTPFQLRVWQEISSIPYGATLTYKDIALRFGDVHLSRAIGTACGKNPLALFIPCHRVVRVHGEDFSYSWGKERKKWLLVHEGYCN